MEFFNILDEKGWMTTVPPFSQEEQKVYSTNISKPPLKQVVSCPPLIGTTVDDAISVSSSSPSPSNSPRQTPAETKPAIQASNSDGTLPRRRKRVSSEASIKDQSVLQPKKIKVEDAILRKSPLLRDVYNDTL